MNGFALLCRVQVLALVNSLAPERQGSKRRSRTTRLALAGVVAIALGALMAAYVALMGMGLVAMGLTEVIPAFATVYISPLMTQAEGAQRVTAHNLPLEKGCRPPLLL